MPATDSLPWNALKISEPEIPWLDLRRLADAAATDADVRCRLMDELNEFLDRYEADDEDCFDDMIDFAVPAVFSMAANRMDDAGRAEVGRFMLEMFRRAGELDSEPLTEVLIPTAAAYGDALIDPAIEVIQREGEKLDCWYSLFAALRGVREPSPARDRLVRFCRELLGQQRVLNMWSSATAPARVLSGFRDMESLPLLEKLRSGPRDGELADIIEEMKSAADTTKWKWFDEWDRHVETWLPKKVQETRDYLENKLNEPSAAEEDEADTPFNDDDYFDNAWERTLADSRADDDDAGNWDRSNIAPIHRESPRIGRNEPCSCGSGKKYKKCCGRNQP